MHFYRVNDARMASKQPEYKKRGNQNGHDKRSIDEGNNPVLMPRDERFPNAPDTLNADKGPRPAEETANRETLNTQELEDAYAQTDPGVTPKD